ncbi:WGR domain-containing protein [Pyxidicoccus sp. 3LFB2]
MTRYEFTEEGSSKFWEIELSDASLTTRWGRIGTQGQQKAQSFPNAAEAKKQHDTLVQEKERKGYVRVGAEPPPAGQALEDAILEAPDNVDAYLVLADWLQSQGDPRGELIMLHHAATQARGAEAEALAQQAAQLIARHPSLLSEELARAMVQRASATTHELSVQWHLGYIRAARLARSEWESPFDLAATVKALLMHPSARFLRELTLGIPNFESGSSYDGVIQAIVEAGGSRSLRSLFIGDFKHPGETEISWTLVGNVEPLYAVLPRLASLRLRGGGVALGKIQLPELREFTIETGGLPLAAVKSIARAQWPNLERLEVWFGNRHYGAEGGVSDIRPILDGKGLPKLRRLGLCNTDFTDRLCRALPDAAVLPQLETLDLSMGTMTDRGAALLAEHAEAFRHLRQLDVSDNLISEEAVAQVAGLCPDVQHHFQRPLEHYEDDDGYRYVAVGE